MFHINLNQVDISTITSILALIISIYSVIKTNRIERFELIIRDPEYKQYGDKYRLTFSVFNSGIRPICLIRINFKDPSDKDLLLPLHFDLDEYYHQIKLNEYDKLSTVEKTSFDWLPYRVQNNEYPSKTYNIIINQSEYVSLTYYLDKSPQPIDLIVTANEKLTSISKTKTYSLIPTYSKENN